MHIRVYEYCKFLEANTSNAVQTFWQLFVGCGRDDTTKQSLRPGAKCRQWEVLKIGSVRKQCGWDAQSKEKAGVTAFLFGLSLD